MIRLSNSVEPAQARRFAGPDLGPNCLQKLSSDDKKVSPADKQLKKNI